MSQNEEFVRQHWVIDELALEMSHGGFWHFKEGHPLNAVGWWPAIGEELWAAAAEFTRKRLRQITEIEEEIKYLDCYRPYSKDDASARRLIRRLEDTLAALKKGMRTR